MRKFMLAGLSFFLFAGFAYQARQTKRHDVNFLRSTITYSTVQQDTTMQVSVTSFWQPVSDRRGDRVGYYTMQVVALPTDSLAAPDSIILRSDTTDAVALPDSIQVFNTLSFVIDDFIQVGDTLLAVSRVNATDNRNVTGRWEYSDTLFVVYVDTIGPPAPVMDSVVVDPRQ